MRISFLRTLGKWTYTLSLLGLIACWGTSLWGDISVSSGFWALNCTDGICWFRYLSGSNVDRRKMRPHRIYPDSSEFQISISHFEVYNREWWQLYGRTFGLHWPRSFSNEWPPGVQEFCIDEESSSVVTSGLVEEVNHELPLWLPTLVLSIPMAFFVWRRRNRRGRDACRVCGYNLTGNVSGRCPECGTRSAKTGWSR